MGIKKLLVISVAAVAALASGGVAGLPAAARFLEAPEAIEPADCIVVFAGDYTFRPVHAARLYHRGYAKVVATTGAFVSDELCAVGLEIPGAQLSALVLQRDGVPPEQISALVSGYSTLEEAQAFARLVEERSFTRVIVVTSPYHVRRAKLILGDVLEGRNVRIMGSAAHNPSRSRWWRTKGGLVHLNNEFIKLVFHKLPASLRNLILEPVPRAGSGKFRRQQCPPV